MAPKIALWETVYNTITGSMPDGISMDDLKKKLKIGTNTVYGCVHTINKHKKDLPKKITNENGAYIAYDNHTIMNNNNSASFSEKAPTITRSTGNRKQTIENVPLSQIIPKPLINTISELSDNDKRDFNDMIKKSIFYGKSAIALLEANNQANSLTKGV